MTKITFDSDFTSLDAQPWIGWNGRNVAVLKKEWSISITIDEMPYLFRIPKGFTADGSTASSLSGVFGIPAAGRNNAAWLLHDYLYVERIIDRKKVDLIFKEMLKELGMGSFRSNLAYWGARIGGYFYWRS